MIARKKILCSLFILLLCFNVVPSVFAGSGDGGGEVDGTSLDYEQHDDVENESENMMTSKNMSKSIDFDSLDEPLIYHTAIWLNNIGKIEKASGTYELDFWFIMESDDVNFLEMGVPPVGFVNSKTVKLDSEYVEEHYYEIRVRGIFFNILDYREYPFEKIELNIEIEPDMPFHSENAVFVISKELVGVDEKVNVIGWDIQEPTFAITEHDYKNWYSFSQFIVTIPIERSATGALLKTLLPVTIIMGISLVIFIIPENFSSRIYLTAPLLLALVFLHRASLGELPTLSYMTIFDKIMVIYYALFANSILSLAIQMRIHIYEKDDKKIRKVNQIMAFLIPVIVIILAVSLFNL